MIELEKDFIFEQVNTSNFQNQDPFFLFNKLSSTKISLSLIVNKGQKE